MAKQSKSKIKQGVAWDPTPQQRADVLLMRATGMGREAIASVIGVSVGCLVNHCRYELEFLYNRKKAEMFKILDEAAQGGNIAAAKTLLAFIERQELSVQPPAKPIKQEEEEQPRLGKSESLNLESKTAHEGTAWASKLQ